MTKFKNIVLCIIWIYISVIIIPYLGIFGFTLLPTLLFLDFLKKHFGHEGKSRKINKSANIDYKEEMSEYQLERFAVECNAYVEHKQEMEEYKEYYDI